MHGSPRKFLLALGTVAMVCASPDANADFLSPDAAQVFTLTRWVSDLRDVSDFRFLPGGRLVIVEKSGIVRVGTPQSLIPSDRLPVDPLGEKGLLGVEVDPAFATNGFIYLFWSLSDVAGRAEVWVSRFTVGSDDRIDLASEEILFREPQGDSNIGGGLAIGPDGKLYIGVGDGGCSSSGPSMPSWFATCLSNGNGKILRVNLDGSIPSDNPLVGATSVRACGNACDVDPATLGSGVARSQIWAWGLRNPRRIWFDSTTGNLWVGDAGEGLHEEIDLVERGKHYGWPLRDALTGELVSRCGQYTPQSGDCVDPIYFCQRQGPAGGTDADCRAIAAGRIVDSCTWPTPWRGRYFFGDSAPGEVWSLPVNAQRDGVTGARVKVATLLSGDPVAFQVGPDGDLYVAAHALFGSIFRISPIAPGACAPSDGGVADGGPGGGLGDGGAGAVMGGGHPVTRSPSSAGACGCAASGPQALLALLGFLGIRRRERTA